MVIIGIGYLYYIPKINISLPEKFGAGIEKRKIVAKNPVIPIKFFIALRWIALNFFDEISKNITAEDQQIAVAIAYKSPINTRLFSCSKHPHDL